MSNNFMTLCPRVKEYIGLNLTGIPLRVIHDDGIEYSPHVKFSEANLSNGHTYFHNSSGETDSFSIRVIIHKDDMIELTEDIRDVSLLNNEDVSNKRTVKKSIIEVLDYYIRRGMPFYITTRAVDIKWDTLWIITENGTRKQRYDDGYVEWDLTFSKYYEIEYAVFNNVNTSVRNAIAKYNQSKKGTKSGAKSKKKNQNKFKKKCSVSKLKYSKEKKVVACVKLMQKLLYLNGCLKEKKYIDGWYGDTTKKAVKHFQKKYHKKYKLKQTGNVDTATFKALYSV